MRQFRTITQVVLFVGIEDKIEEHLLITWLIKPTMIEQETLRGRFVYVG